MPTAERQPREHEEPGARGVGREAEAEHVAEVGQAVVAAEAHLVAEEGEHQRVGQRLGDDREVDAGDAAAEGEVAEDEGEQPRHEQHHQAGEPEHVEAVPEPRQLGVAQEHHEVGQHRVGVDPARRRSRASCACPSRSRRARRRRRGRARGCRRSPRRGRAPPRAARRSGTCRAARRCGSARGPARPARPRGCRPAPAPRRRTGWRGRCRCGGR